MSYRVLQILEQLPILLGEDTEEDFWAELNHLALEHIYAYRTPLQEVVHIVPRIPQALPMHGGVESDSLPAIKQPVFTAPS